MNDLAEETWSKISTGGPRGLNFGEDSLTDHNLWILDRQHPGLNVHHYNQSEERYSGADWEWWIGSDARGWICLRIQAKRIYKKSYPQLDHPGEGDSDYQYDTLIDSCDLSHGQYPLHVFYNGWAKDHFGDQTGWAKPANWLACPRSAQPGDCIHADVEHYGCAVSSSFSVKRIHDKRDGNRRLVTQHISWSVPWSYLFGNEPLASEYARRYEKFELYHDGGEYDDEIEATRHWLDWVQRSLDLMTLRAFEGDSPDWANALRRIPFSQRRFARLPGYANVVRLGIAEDSIRDVTLANARMVIVLDSDA